MKLGFIHRPYGLKCFSIVFLVMVLSSCALAPGGHIGYSTRTESLKDIVTIEPINLELIQRLDSVTRSKVADAAQSITDADPLLKEYDYLIGRGDVLNIIVYEHPELTIPAGSERSAAESGNVVHSDGTIFYPYIGRVHAAGRSVRDLRDEIQRRLADFIAQPQVDVKVASFNAKKAFVTGEVVQPGTYPITNIPMRVLDALGFSGGMTERANWHEVILTRGGQDIRLSVYDMLTYGNLQNNILLQDGDVLHIPDVGNQQVYVMGEVNDPMALPMGKDRLSLTNAISRAGGIREATANAAGIFVVRRNPEESEKFATVYQLNARNATAFLLGSRFILEPTDVVYVTAAPISRWNRVLSQLLPSLTTIYQATEIGENVDDLQN